MASSVTGNGLPRGGKVFSTLPDLFFIPEFIFGGLVWTLVASTYVDPPNPLGWVMFVSVFCFVITTIFLLIFLCGGNQGSMWPGLDVGYHFIAVVFYLSASVILAYITILKKQTYNIFPLDSIFKAYQEDIAAVVMAHVATLLYFIHAIMSALRWKSS